jgi:hypothetical protein
MWKHVEKDSHVGVEGIEKEKPVTEGWKLSPAEKREGESEVSEPEASMSMEEDKPVPEGWKPSPVEERAGGCEVSKPKASMSMSVSGGTEWSEEPDAGIRIGAHSEEVLLRGKPVIEFHHGRSTQGRTSLTTQQGSWLCCTCRADFTASVQTFSRVCCQLV